MKRIFQSQLVRGSFLILLANNAVNFGNFLFNLFMGRLLTPKDFGNLGAILSLFVLLGVPLSIFNISMVKIVSTFYGKKNIRAIAHIFHSYTPKLFLLGIITVFIVLLSSPYLSLFLHLDSLHPLFILSLYFFLSFPTSLSRSILQGMLLFHFLTFNSIIEVLLKLIISISLVLLNVGLLGALTGPLLSGFAGYILIVIELNMLFKKKDTPPKTALLHTSFWKTAKPVFFATLALTLFFNSDMILVRHFLSDAAVGQYVALSTTGKIIFYAVGPVIGVMFPLISSRVGNGISYILPLLGTLVMSLFLSFGIIFIYFLSPRFVLNILYAGKYDNASSYLILFSFFVILYSINSILTHFLLSVSYVRPIYMLFAVSILQSIGIVLWHDTISTIIWINILVSILYFFTVSFFVWKREKTVLTKVILKMLPKSIYGRQEHVT